MNIGLSAIASKLAPVPLQTKNFQARLAAMKPSIVSQNDCLNEKAQFLTGADAVKKARQLAAAAWEPDASFKIQDYNSLAERLDGKVTQSALYLGQNKDISVIATYGDIIITANKQESQNAESRAALLSQTLRCFEKIESTDLGCRMLGEVLKSGMPLLMRVSNDEDERIKNDFLGAAYPATAFIKRTKKQYYLSNYDEVVFYPNSTQLLNNDKLAPPWLTLAHEIRHLWQFACVRNDSLRMNPDLGNSHKYGLLTYELFNDDRADESLFWNGDNVGRKVMRSKTASNTVIDVEDDANSFEQRILHEASLPADLTTAKYHNYKAKVFVDDPIQPTRITRTIEFLKKFAK